MGSFLGRVDWTAAGVIATVLVGIATILVAGITFFFQLRGLNRQIASATYQQIVLAFNEFSKLIIDKPELYDAIYGKPYAQPTDAKFGHQVDWAIGIRFGWFESVIVQRKRYRILSASVADHWRSILVKELGSPAMLAHWHKNREYYHPDLRDEIQQILASKQHESAGTSSA
jgi:hypothetical protein